MTAEVDLSPTIEALTDRYASSTAEAILADAIGGQFKGRIALVSSFGTESAVLLNMVANIDASTPVLFLDTGRLYGETLRYRDRMTERLGLTDVRSLKPDPRIAAEDPDMLLFNRDADRCCFLRKVLPLRLALEDFDAWINGRKGHHGGDRAAMPVVEADGFMVKYTPLAGWDEDMVEAYHTTHDLPRHPLWDDGFPSVGCMPCTSRPAAGEGFRAGRWAGGQKTECGIHLPVTDISEARRAAAGC